MIGVDLHGPHKTCCLLYLGNTRISRTEFVYADDKRVLDRKCLLISVLPAACLACLPASLPTYIRKFTLHN